MVPTNHFSVFLKNNDLEFRSLVISLCDSLNYPGSPEDIIQDLYVKFMTSRIIEDFNPNHRQKETKMTTYLFKIIKNFIVSKMVSSECRYSQDLRNYEPSCDPEIDLNVARNPVNVNFVDVLLHNESSDHSEGLKSKLKSFERYLKRARKNKTYLKKRKAGETDFIPELRQELSRLKRREVDLNDPEYHEIMKRVERVRTDSGCTLIDVFTLFYRGYSGKQIAKIYSVSDMSVTNVKHKLAKALLNYGIKPEGKNDRTKMPKMQVRRRSRRA